MADGLFSGNSADAWYAQVRSYKGSDDPDVRAIGEQMDRCPNNPRHGGPGFFGKRRELDRR